MARIKQSLGLLIIILYTALAYSQSEGVDPLLTTYWAQGCYYNDSCPEDVNGSCGHAKTGCGATAMAQLLKYYNFPVNGTGFHSFDHPTYGSLSADFENTFYDWTNMPNNLNVFSQPDEVSAVATLMYHCGVAVEMDYAYNASYSGTTSIRDAFPDFFGYACSAQLLNKAHFSDTVWKTMIRNELDHQRPVFYAISSGSGGHFIVIDGYTDNGHFHCNWGDGNASGYNKLLTELLPVQEAIIGLVPDTAFCDSLTTFVARHCRFDDGSGQNPYPSGITRRYLIAPPGASGIALFFSKFNTVSGSDYVRIYDGNSTNAPLINEFSGSNLPPHILSSAGELLIEFTTAIANEDEGWEVTYSAEIPGKISGLYTITDSTGTFDDGSGSGNYTNHTDAFWLINPPEASSITLTFNYFNTEFSCDYLRIYDGDNPSPDYLLGVFSGNDLPEQIIAPSGKMLLHFNTDFSTTLPGWGVSFTSGFEKIFLDLNVFLEGPFDGSEMTTGLNSSFLHITQPYFDAPWNYFGNEAVTAVPNSDIVDWVLLELRETQYDADSATGEKRIGRQAVFLLKDGSIRSQDGTSLPYFCTTVNENLYVLVRHRNHLDIMSAFPLVESGGVYTYDFTSGESMIYGGIPGCKELSAGVWGMVSGDTHADGIIDIYDKISVWESQSGACGYLQSDLNMDGQANNIDKNNLWFQNTGMNSQVPE